MDKGKTPASKRDDRLPEDEYSDNSVEMRIPARPEWVRVARLATAGVAARLGFSYDDIEDLKLAVAEACNNAILHGGASTSASSEHMPLVTIRWTTFPDRLQISVSDEGRLEGEDLPLAPQSASGQSASGELREGGMGLLLIASLMDKVESRSGTDSNTTLLMTRFAPHVNVTNKAADDRAPSTPARGKPKVSEPRDSKTNQSKADQSKASEDARRLLSDALHKR